jgi:hypothetical protein
MVVEVSSASQVLMMATKQIASPVIIALQDHRRPDLVHLVLTIRAPQFQSQNPHSAHRVMLVIIAPTLGRLYQVWTVPLVTTV